MRTWVFLFGTAAAAATAVVVLTLTLKKTRTEAASDPVPLIEDCHERIRRIETELHRIRPAG